MQGNPDHNFLHLSYFDSVCLVRKDIWLSFICCKIGMILINAKFLNNAIEDANTRDHGNDNMSPIPRMASP